MTKRSIDDLSYQIIGAAIEVHKQLGPGLLESVYHRCLRHELSLANLEVAMEVEVPVTYRGINLDVNLRCDLLVNKSIVVELKSAEGLAPIFTAQVLTYMRLLNVPKGILINFNCRNIFKEGQLTLVNELYRKLPP